MAWLTNPAAVLSAGPLAEENAAVTGEAQGSSTLRYVPPAELRLQSPSNLLRDDLSTVESATLSIEKLTKYSLHNIE